MCANVVMVCNCVLPLLLVVLPLVGVWGSHKHSSMVGMQASIGMRWLAADVVLRLPP